MLSHRSYLQPCNPCKSETRRFIQASPIVLADGNQELTVSSTPVGTLGGTAPATVVIPLATEATFIPSIANTLSHLGSTLIRTGQGIRTSYIGTVRVGASVFVLTEDGPEISARLEFLDDDGTITEVVPKEPLTQNKLVPLGSVSFPVTVPGVFRVVFSSAAEEVLISATATISAAIQQL